MPPAWGFPSERARICSQERSSATAVHSAKGGDDGECPEDQPDTCANVREGARADAIPTIARGSRSPQQIGPQRTRTLCQTMPNTCSESPKLAQFTDLATRRASGHVVYRLKCTCGLRIRETGKE